jgi:hypothetical protein
MTTKKQTKKENGKQATVKKPDHKDEKFLREAYEKAGWSAGTIARECGVSRAAVLFQLKKHGIDVSKTRKTRKPGSKQDYKNKTWLTNQLKKGLSIFTIAKQQGVSYASVSRQAMKLVPAHIIEEGKKVRKAKKEKSKTAKKKTAAKK